MQTYLWYNNTKYPTAIIEDHIALTRHYCGETKIPEHITIDVALELQIKGLARVYKLHICGVGVAQLFVQPTVLKKGVVCLSAQYAILASMLC